MIFINFIGIIVFYFIAAISLMAALEWINRSKPR